MPPQPPLSPIILAVLGVSSPDITNLLNTPLSDVFNGLWTGLQPTAIGQSQAAVTSNKPNAYGIQVSVPPSGTLRAEVGMLAPGMVGRLPPGMETIMKKRGETIVPGAIAPRVGHDVPRGTKLGDVAGVRAARSLQRPDIATGGRPANGLSTSSRCKPVLSPFRPRRSSARFPMSGRIVDVRPSALSALPAPAE